MSQEIALHETKAKAPPREHKWFVTKWKFVACEDCGTIKRFDGKKNKACRGRVRVTIR